MQKLNLSVCRSVIGRLSGHICVPHRESTPMIEVYTPVNFTQAWLKARSTRSRQHCGLTFTWQIELTNIRYHNKGSSEITFITSLGYLYSFSSKDDLHTKNITLSYHHILWCAFKCNTGTSSKSTFYNQYYRDSFITQRIKILNQTLNQRTLNRIAI